MVPLILDGETDIAHSRQIPPPSGYFLKTPERFQTMLRTARDNFLVPRSILSFSLSFFCPWTYSFCEGADQRTNLGLPFSRFPFFCPKGIFLDGGLFLFCAGDSFQDKNALNPPPFFRLQGFVTN